MQGDSRPGWRTEQRYSHKVLIGNWLEERLQFTQECKPLSSTYRQDFRLWTELKPDTIMRRTALRRAEGLPTKLLFSHHDPPTSQYLVSLYDESYGRRGPSHLPAHRTWHSDKMAWVPERSDHPIHGPPTNYGLVETQRAQVGQQQVKVPVVSVYKDAYPLPPTSAFCQPRHARAPCLISGSSRDLEQNLKWNQAPGGAVSLLPTHNPVPSLAEDWTKHFWP
ncbi:uncharacterized protein C1orf158 homolog [Electrophorus electricus]|uniref:uncharacterized protein C1orf158 homolog n=1 Tax=Electrophorus electricus TaxID=8005 RepID=UPI0015D06A08|nr:uncharacterized protein C1orf158 homolog [Electrophorus electricus]